MDHNNECKCKFGTHAQAHTQNTPVDSMAERTTDCVCLRGNDNAQGGHALFNLSTGEVAARSYATEVEMTSTAAEKMHKLAEQDEIKAVKFADHRGVADDAEDAEDPPEPHERGDDDDSDDESTVSDADDDNDDVTDDDNDEVDKNDVTSPSDG